MYKLVLSLLAALLLTSTASAQTLHRPEKALGSFDEVATAILSGQPVQVSVFHRWCDVPNRSYLEDDWVSVINPSEFMFHNDDSVATSLTHFTRANPQFPGESVLEHVRYVLKNDDSLTLRVEILEPASHKPLKNAIEIHCKLNESAFISKVRGG